MYYNLFQAEFAFNALTSISDSIRIVFWKLLSKIDNIYFATKQIYRKFSEIADL